MLLPERELLDLDGDPPSRESAGVIWTERRQSLDVDDAREMLSDGPYANSDGTLSDVMPLPPGHLWLSQWKPSQDLASLLVALMS